jgi:IS4 transposase
MLLDQVFEKFVAKSPVSVMVRGTLEYALQPKLLNDLFELHADGQYTRTLLFSTVVDLLSLVTCGVHASVRAAYRASPEDVAVSLTSVYNKLNGLETPLSAELLRCVFRQLEPVQRQLGGTLPALIPGYHTRILDGNHLAATEHRLGETRHDSAAPLPGQALVVLDPALMLVRDVFPCEDGHAQERSLLDAVLQTVQDRDVWMADRNFCVLSFLLGVAKRGGCFIIREHKGLTWQAAGNLRSGGRSASGWVREQRVSVLNEAGQRWFLRRVVLQLDQPTRDGETELALLTNLPREVVAAGEVAEHYRKRWTIETAFQELTEALCCEVKALCYPRAALFAFCVALVSYNVLSVVKGALRGVHGAEKVQEEVSGYLLADAVTKVHEGMMIATGEEAWAVFGGMTVAELVAALRELAGNVRLQKYRRQPRGPKKPARKRKYNKKHPHVATSRLLAERGTKKRSLQTKQKPTP